MARDSLSVISSAIISALPGWSDRVVTALGEIPNAQVWALKDNKIIITLEADTRGEAGARLAAIALLDGVATANMVFECVEQDGGVQS